MIYGNDLSKIHILKYKHYLKLQDLNPSRQVLQENIEKNLKILQKTGLKYLSELKKALLTSSEIDKLSKETGISSEYLNMLKIELIIFENNEDSITSFRDIIFEDQTVIDTKTIIILEKKRINNTKDFYEYYYKNNNEKKISEDLGISSGMVKRLISLSDFIRINGKKYIDTYNYRKKWSNHQNFNIDSE